MIYGLVFCVLGLLLVVNVNGYWIGLLFGGCVEDDFFEWVVVGGFFDFVVIVCYGEGDDLNLNVCLFCGGIFDVLVENLVLDCDVQVYLCELELVLFGQCCLFCEVELGSGVCSLCDDFSYGFWVECDGECVCLCVGVVQCLLLVGYFSVVYVCVEFGKGLGFEVIFCDLCEEVLCGVLLEGIEICCELFLLFIVDGGCYVDMVVVVLIYDLKIDDLVMFEVVCIEVFYIGVMGLWVILEKCFECLWCIGGLGDVELVWIYVLIGFNLGSKMLVEIVLVVLVDIFCICNGIFCEWF